MSKDKTTADGLNGILPENEAGQERSSDDFDSLDARLNSLALAGKQAREPRGKRSVRRRAEKDAADEKSSVPMSEQWKAFVGELKKEIRTQRFKRGGFAALMTALFIAFVVLTNLVAVRLTDKYPAFSPDMTAGKVYTLSDVTVGLLKNLDEHVEIDILATEYNCMNADVTVDPYGHIAMAAELIKRYEQYSDNVKVVFVDLSTNPGFLDLVDEYRDSLYDYSVVVRSARRTRVTSFYEMLPSLSSTAATDSYSTDDASSLTETYISSLIKTVTIDTVPTVAYLDALGGGDYVDYLLESLYENGYDIITSSEFNFGFDPIPDEVQMIIISSPVYDLSQNQLIMLSDWLENGGELGKTLMVMTSAVMPEMKNLSTLLEEWGMNFTRSTVFEGNAAYVPSTMSADTFYPQLCENEYFSIEEDFKKTLVAGALDIEIPRQLVGSNIVVNTILTSSPNGWVVPIGTEFDPTAYSSADGAARAIMAESTYYREDLDGVEHRSDVIVCPSSLCINDYFNSSVYGNFDLLMGVCNRRCGIADETLNIEAKNLDPVDFSIGNGGIVALTVIFGYCVPLAAAIAGLVVYLRRRRL